MVTIVRRAAFDLRPRGPPAELVDIVCERPQTDMLHPGLARVLAALPEMHRQALLLMYVYGLTHAEIATALAAPLGTVKSWVRRGAAAVKEAVGDWSERPLLVADQHQQPGSGRDLVVGDMRGHAVIVAAFVGFAVDDHVAFDDHAMLEAGMLVRRQHPAGRATQQEGMLVP